MSDRITPVEGQLNVQRNQPAVVIVEHNPRLSGEIVMTQDGALRAKLGAKLEEYKGRLRGTGAAEQDPGDVCKMEILEQLFTHGRVSLADLEARMKDRYKEMYVHVVGAFENAWAVIDAYNRGDSANVHGGTGLPSQGT
jgi:hypothetical protein